jgi:hypothetical protein
MTRNREQSSWYSHSQKTLKGFKALLGMMVRLWIISDFGKDGTLKLCILSKEVMICEAEDGEGGDNDEDGDGEMG